MTLPNAPAAPLTLHAQLSLDSLPDSNIALLQPIPYLLLAEDGQIIAEAAELNEFGCGDTPAAAIADLQQTILELYRALEQDQDRLGPDLQSVWQTLQSKVARR